MKKTIEWYDQGINALQKLIRQHEVELEQTISQFEALKMSNRNKLKEWNLLKTT